MNCTFFQGKSNTCGACVIASFFHAFMISVIYHSFSPFPEVLAPLIVGTQNQFNFSHITAGATAMGKVPVLCFVNPH